jgi:hypothetical protein
VTQEQRLKFNLILAIILGCTVALLWGGAGYGCAGGTATGSVIAGGAR